MRTGDGVFGPEGGGEHGVRRRRRHLCLPEVGTRESEGSASTKLSRRLARWVDYARKTCLKSPPVQRLAGREFPAAVGR